MKNVLGGDIFDPCKNRGCDVCGEDTRCSVCVAVANPPFYNAVCQGK